MSRSFLLRILLPLLLLAAVGFAVWTGWQAWRVNQDLSSAVDDASTLQDAVRAGDQEAASTALTQLQTHTDAAQERTQGMTWSVVTRFPVVGDDASGVRLVTDVVADLTDSGIAPLVDQAGNLDSMVPRDGQVPLEPLVGLQEPVSAANASFAEADARLAAQDPSSYVDPLQDKYTELATRVADTSRALARADTALQVMPSMLGADGPRTFLLVFQNNAEVRATGGLPGAVSVLNADDGRLSMTRQSAGSALGEAEEPVLPLSPAEQEIWGTQLGTYFIDANFTPDFPRASALMAARWEQEFDDQIDGVLAVDPVALSYLLEVTGPITVLDQTLSSDNVVDEVLHGIYLREPDPIKQDEFFKAAARAIFDVVTGGGGDPQGLLRALERGASEHRLLLHSFEPEEQDVLTDTVVAGDLTAADPARPQVGLFLNDNTGAKMSYFLRTEATVEATSCQAGVQGIEGTATFTSTAPADAATTLPDYVTGGGSFGVDPGGQIVAVRVFSPAGGSIDEVSLGGKVRKDTPIVDLDGRQVATSYVFLGPQDTIELSWRMSSGPDQQGDVDVTVTPSPEPTNASFTADSAC